MCSFLACSKQINTAIGLTLAEAALPSPLPGVKPGLAIEDFNADGVTLEPVGMAGKRLGDQELEKSPLPIGLAELTTLNEACKFIPRRPGVHSSKRVRLLRHNAARF